MREGKKTIKELLNRKLVEFGTTSVEKSLFIYGFEINVPDELKEYKRVKE